MRSNAKLVGMALMGTLLTACGGGGGGGGAPETSDPVAISEANGVDVARTAYQAASEFADPDNFDEMMPLTSGAAGDGMHTVLGFTTEQIARFRDGRQSLARVRHTETANCPDGGTIRVTFNDNDDDEQLSGGDSLSIRYDDCNSGGFVTDGTMSWSLGTWSESSFSMTISYSGFSMSGGGESLSMSGGITMSAEQIGTTISYSLTNTYFTMSDGVETATISNLDHSVSYDSATNAYSYAVNGTLDSTDIGGSITYATLTTFEGTGTNAPYVGQLKVTGADDTSVTLTALDEINVRIELDTDGDGATDVTIDTTWAELDS